MKHIRLVYNSQGIRNTMLEVSVNGVDVARFVYHSIEARLKHPVIGAIYAEVYKVD